jgi:hypothetical protein
MANQSKKKDYKVGYRKTSEKTRFKKGQSGNPRGRPKGSKSLKTLFAEEWAREITVFVNGKPEKITMKRALVRREVQKGVVHGDIKNLMALGAFDEVEEAPQRRLTFTLALDDCPPQNDWSDDDYDYSQPQLKGPGSKDPG